MKESVSQTAMKLQRGRLHNVSDGSSDMSTKSKKWSKNKNKLFDDRKQMLHRIY
jgi:hypothetical protein